MQSNILNKKLRLAMKLLNACLHPFRSESSSPFSFFTKHAHSLSFFSHHKAGGNDLSALISHSSNGIGLYYQWFTKMFAIGNCRLTLRKWPTCRNFFVHGCWTNNRKKYYSETFVDFYQRAIMMLIVVPWSIAHRTICSTTPKGSPACSK